MGTSRPWWEAPLVGFDLETTGVDEENDRIVTANITYQAPDGTTRVRNFLVNPGVEIPIEATNVHGVTTEHAREHGVAPIDAIKEIISLLRASSAYPIVAFNGAYDFSLLDREARRHGVPPFTPELAIDPFILDKQIDKYRRGKRQLGAVCTVYGIDLENAHNADADALAAVLLARAMGRAGKLPADPRELHLSQIQWYAEQSESFERYLRQHRPDAVISRHWPVRPLPDTSAA